MVFRRKKYLINQQIQLKYVVYVAFLAILTASLFNYFIHVQLKNQNKIMAQYSQFKQDAAGLINNLNIADTVQTEKFIENIEKSDDKLQSYLSFNRYLPLLIFVFTALIAAIIVGWGILLTHRLVGPIYVIETLLDQIENGKKPDIRRPLRKKDEFKEFYSKLTGILSNISKRG